MRLLYDEQILQVIYFFVAVILLSGCATSPKSNIPVSKDFWKGNEQKIAVVTTKIPEAKFYHTGQEGLLDLAINNMVTSSFQNYLKTVDTASQVSVPKDFTEKLSASGFDVQKYDESINIATLGKSRHSNSQAKDFADQDFSQVATGLNADELLLINTGHWCYA